MPELPQACYFLLARLQLHEHSARHLTGARDVLVLGYPVDAIALLATQAQLDLVLGAAALSENLSMRFVRIPE